MDRHKKIFSAEDVLLEIAGSYNELDESEDSDDGDLLDEGEDDPIINQ